MMKTRFVNASLLTGAGLEWLDRATEQVRHDFQLVIDGLEEGALLGQDAMLFLQGVLSIDNSRLFRTGAVARQFANRFTVAELYEDMGEAFKRPNAVRMSSESGDVLEQQIDLMDKITHVAGEHVGIMMLLGLMKERLDEHYYHGLRAGIAYCSLSEMFDPNNELLLSSRLIAGITHDVGKLEVPRAILFKRGSLTDEEMDVMTAHDTSTERILTPFSDRYPHLAHIAANHHLSDRVSQSDDPMVERTGVLLRIADVYDALASERDYKPALPMGKVAQLMYGYFPEFLAEIRFLLETFPCPIK